MVHNLRGSSSGYSLDIWIGPNDTDVVNTFVWETVHIESGPTVNRTTNPEAAIKATVTA